MEGWSIRLVSAYRPNHGRRNRLKSNRQEMQLRLPAINMSTDLNGDSLSVLQNLDPMCCRSLLHLVVHFMAPLRDQQRLHSPSNL